MKSSIYVSAEQIQVIGYAGSRVREFAACSLPEGIIYNGLIMDAPFLTESLISMKREHPGLFSGGVSLVMDGSSILSRRLFAPKLRNNQYLQLVRDEFIDSISSSNDLVCGYRRLDEHAIMAFAVDKNQVDSYISAFKAAGIKTASIHIGVELLLSFINSIPELKHSTAVLNVIDGFTMLSMIFVGGSNIFTSRTRLYGDENDKIHSSILANLNGLLQFARSQSHEITESFYLGLNEADLVVLQENNPYPVIRIDSLKINEGEPYIPPTAHFACLNTRFGNGVDLLVARKELDKFIKRQRPKNLWVPALGIYILMLAGIAGFFLFEAARVGESAQDIYGYINSLAITARLELIETLQVETASYHNIARQAVEKAAWASSMPEAVSPMLNFVIYDHGVDITVTDFEFNERSSIRVSAIAADAQFASDYIDALYDGGVARRVIYRGFGSGGSGMFTFTIDITLSLEGAE